MSTQWALPNSSGPAFGLEAGIQLSGVVKKRENGKASYSSCRNARLCGFDQPPADGWKGSDSFEASSDIGEMMDETMELAVVELSPWD